MTVTNRSIKMKFVRNRKFMLAHIDAKSKTKITANQPKNGVFFSLSYLH